MNLALRKAQEDYTESYLLTEGLKLERELNAANDKQETKIRELRERINRLEELAEELAYEDCAASRKDIWQGFKESQ
jgi:DNA-binding protein H-NS